MIKEAENLADLTLPPPSHIGYVTKDIDKTVVYNILCKKEEGVERRRFSS